MEFILRRPSTYRATSEALQVLYTALSELASPQDNNRSGVHIHFNVQDYTEEELDMFLLLYYMNEPALLAGCAESRQFNHFCLPLWRSKVSMATLNNEGWESLAAKDWKYAALNLTSLPRFGTLEFRALEAPCPKEKILAYMDFFVSIEEKVKKAGNMLTLLTEIKTDTHAALVADPFGILSHNLDDVQSIYRQLQPFIIRSTANVHINTAVQSFQLLSQGAVLNDENTEDEIRRRFLLTQDVVCNFELGVIETCAKINPTRAACFVDQLIRGSFDCGGQTFVLSENERERVRSDYPFFLHTYNRGGSEHVLTALRGRSATQSRSRSNGEIEGRIIQRTRYSDAPPRRIDGTSSAFRAIFEYDSTDPTPIPTTHNVRSQDAGVARSSNEERNLLSTTEGVIVTDGL